MAMPPRHSRYEFIEQLADNGFTEAWRACDRQTGVSCFVKRPSQTATLPIDFILDTLRTSLTLQGQLAGRAIHRAVYSHKRGDDLLIVYPWLADAVTYPEAFTDPAEFAERLRWIGILVDYVHSHELVHRDLKLANFIWSPGSGHPSLYLTDLDLLAGADVRADRKLVGTPGFIAPEVEANESFSARADLYSLGRSLAAFVDAHGIADPDGRLGALIERLTRATVLERPEYLLETLRETAWLDDAAMQSSLKTVFTFRFLSHFRRRGHHRPGWVRQLAEDRLLILGVADEVWHDMETVYCRTPAQTGRAMHRLFDRARLERVGDFWQLVVDDDKLTSCYCDLGIDLGRATGTGMAVSESVEDSSPGLRFKCSATPLKRYLHLGRRITSVRDDAPAVSPAALFEERGDLAMNLNRITTAREAYERAVAQPDITDSARLDVLRKIIVLCLIQSDFERRATAISEAGKLAESLRQPLTAIDLVRQDIWGLMQEGRIDEASEKMAALDARITTEVPESYRSRWLILKVHLGQMGEDLLSVIGAKEEFRQFLEKHGRPDEQLQFLIGLGHQYAEAGDFERALAAAEQAHALDSLPHQRYFERYHLNLLAMSLSRMGRARDAQRALERLVRTSDSLTDRSMIDTHYVGRAWIALDSGRLSEAETLLYRAITTLPGGPQGRAAGLLFQLLARTMMRRGRGDEAETYGQKSLALCEGAGLEVTRLEVKITLALNAFYNGGIPPWPTLCGLISRLTAKSVVFHAANALFHCLVWGSDRVVTEAVQALGGRAGALITGSQVPLYRAITVLLAGRRRRGNDRTRSLKEALRILAGVEEYYLCMVLCERVAEISLEEQSQRRARSYFEMALKYARDIANIPAETRLSRRIDGLNEAGDVRKATLDSIISITEILAGEPEYDIALERMLRFAINETGAERGVFLLRNSQTGELTLRASVDCDEETLKELPSLSENLLNRAARQNRPLVVEDALQDQDLNQFPSIVDHNIRSVIAVPILDQGIVRGLLYLDHHTVPAKFEHADITYLKLIASFVSKLLDAIDRHRAIRIQAERIVEDRRQLGMDNTLVTVNGHMRQIIRDLPQMACTNTDILVRGDSGTGKDVLVNMIHALSLRKDKPFVRVNCAAIPESLMTTELFGIADRMASGVRGHAGKFEQADGGTLFLDEIGDMSPAIQAAVLTAVEDQRIQKVGGRDIHVDVRLIYATNRNLEEMIEAGTFRSDLFERINRLQIIVPPLRERREDIRPLVEHFVELLGRPKVRSLDFAPRAWEVLQAYNWPGNVRELRNMVERLIILKPESRIDIEDLPSRIVQFSRSRPARPMQQSRTSRQELRFRQIARDCDIDLTGLEPELEQARKPGHVGLSIVEYLEREIIRVLLHRHRGNMSQTSRDIGMAYNTLRRRIKKYGLT